MIEVSVIWALDNVLGKQPWTWFRGRGPFPLCNTVAKLRRDLNERNAFENVSAENACCPAREKLDFSFLKLKSLPTGQASTNRANSFEPWLWLRLCKGTGVTNVQRLALPSIDSQSRGNGGKLAAPVIQYAHGTVVSSHGRGSV